MPPEQRLRRRVAWVDTDAGGRIHFTAVFRWAEEAETELVRRLGLPRERWGSFPRRKVEADPASPRLIVTVLGGGYRLGLSRDE